MSTIAVRSCAAHGGPVHPVLQTKQLRGDGQVMSTELTNWLSALPVQRELGREVAKVDKNVAVARAKVTGIAEVGRTALVETLNLAMMQNQATALLPDAAGKLDFIVTQATLGMGYQLNRLASQ
jgi:NADPH-dependent curcumin reductase CurA